MDSLVQLRAPIKNKQLKLYQKARDVTQWVERLPSVHKAPGSFPCYKSLLWRARLYSPH